MRLHGGSRSLCVVSGEVGNKAAVAERGDLHEGLSLAAQLDLVGIGDVEFGSIEADIRADVPCRERRLLGGIAADQQQCRGLHDITLRGEAGLAGLRCALERGGEGDKVGGPMVVDVIGAKHGASELLQQVVFFVRGAV